MSLVINTNEQATRIHGMYNRNNTQMNAAMTRVATAQKINSARDGASMWAISEKMRERIRANDQANQNVQNDTALLKTAQGGISNTLDILNTLKERAINSANDSNISSDRQKIAEEVRLLVQQIDDNANKVKFNGRALLNGAGETGSVSSTSGSASAVTATGNYGDKAVYGITGLYTAADTPIANASSALTALRNKQGEAIFQLGDKITLNWTENGVNKEKNLTVESSTTLANLTAFGTASYFAKDADTTAKNEAGNQLSATAAGYYFVGAANQNVSNFSISVVNKEGATNTLAQTALQITAVQQSYGDDTKGSNEVYYTSKITSGDDNTQFYKLGGMTANKDTINATYTLNVNGKEINFTGGLTVNEINDRMKQAGINAEMHIAGSGDTLTYDGQKVNKGTFGAEVDYKATKLGTAPATTAADATGLYFVGANGEKIESISLQSSATGSAFSTAFTIDSGVTDANADTAFEQVLSLRDGSGGSSSSSSSSSALLPQGQALQFYVGGEANFGINFAIGKATSQNLLGTSVDSFADKFKTKEGATDAINIIDNAISKTLNEQTRLGAMEARLGYTSDNLVTMNENLEAANSAIRDADIAREMTNYMKFAVLSQSSQYMLAQAGQNAYQVLNLLNA